MQNVELIMKYVIKNFTFFVKGKIMREIKCIDIIEKVKKVLVRKESF